MLSLHIMKQFFYLFASFVLMYALTACSSVNSVDYKIDGSSNISRLESDMMYLQTFDDVKLDSAKVIHGEFRFSNSTDNARVAFLQMEGMLLPVVIENGDIVVNINTTGTPVTKGTLLNDRLYHFTKVRDSLLYQDYELEREYTRAWMDDENMAEVVDRLGQQRKELNEQLDELIISTIKENYDNVLGPGIFMIQTWHIHPENYPWVTSIMMEAPESFKSDPYVQLYFEQVKRELNGDDTMPATPTADESTAQSQPTSNETRVPPSLSANPTNEEQAEGVAETTPVEDNVESTPTKEE